MHVAYKHLENRLKIGEFTVGQWAGLFFGVMAALTWGIYVSPFGGYVTLVTAIYLGGIPVAAAFLAGATNFDLWLHLKALSRHRRAVGRYVPGPGHSARGYVLTADQRDDRDAALLASTPDLDLESLWH
jgi:hypothetical protein